MKDEIKEILDNFKNYEERYKKCNENQFIIFYRDIHLLLDYITNLQEENERLNNIINRMEKDLKEMYMTFGEFNEEYTEKKIRELKEGKQ